MLQYEATIFNTDWGFALDACIWLFGLFCLWVAFDYARKGEWEMVLWFLALPAVPMWWVIAFGFSSMSRN